ncbi:MAG TPA: hypothetical protein VLX58_21830 [Bryobacteraceae bacterium]|nr:hypothetical protein [Bryobacteraceae bacterium]
MPAASRRGAGGHGAEAYARQRQIPSQDKIGIEGKIKIRSQGQGGKIEAGHRIEGRIRIEIFRDAR